MATQHYTLDFAMAAVLLDVCVLLPVACLLIGRWVRRGRV